MCSFVMLVALSGVHGPLDEPVWLLDYNAAYQQGRSEQKPLAVVVGSGPDGWRALSRQGRFDHQTRCILAADYVCVYVDTTRSSGKALATVAMIGVAVLAAIGLAMYVMSSSGSGQGTARA